MRSYKARTSSLAVPAAASAGSSSVVAPGVGKRAAREPSSETQFQGMHVLAALVATGAGIALLPIDVVAGSPGVGAVALRPRPYRRVLAITRTATQHDPALASCLAATHTALAG
jgi:DNA-binding transcriptional LysR family regulator